MGASKMPEAEVRIDADLVRGLLAEQHPDLADRPLVHAGGGWDNEIFRLGDDLLVRLPRRRLAAGLARNEQRWLPGLAARLPLPVPAPLRVGAPGRGYPFPWSVCPWLEGETADAASLDGPRAARALGAFVAALHAPAPAEAPRNPFRGVPLARRADAFAGWLDDLAGEIDVAAARAVWRDALAAPPHPGPAVWIHGDLHPANLLVREGRPAAVLDFGDLAAGDPATDLAAAWTVLPAEVRPRFRAAAGGVDDAAWRRARGWALLHGVACLARSADAPRLRAVGARTLARALAGA